MKLLLDENLPHELRHELPGHDCYTVAGAELFRGIVNQVATCRYKSVSNNSLFSQ